MQFMLLFSCQGKLRLQRWCVPLPKRRKRSQENFFKPYSSLYFCCAIEDQDNELITLEIVHCYVKLLDKYFGSVCELDTILNFEKAYFILDEFLLGGEVQEIPKKNVSKAIQQTDLLQEEAETPCSVLEETGLR
ncbi:hypothetical protein FD755_012507 [Muntiacus reevesi]|uniref:AP complex subunit sigma n=1 Tax=Muntiacus reevesi TaxID=9886 RepID=A0A5N3XP34_MUNRE|nr:hypothetical protein FD755_012507 [Muntiacus reevesi]